MPFQKNHKYSPKTKIKQTDLARFKALSKVFSAEKLAQIFGISISHAGMMKYGYRVLKSAKTPRYTKPHSNRKLTDKQVKALRKEFKSGKSQYFLSRKYKLSQPTIWDIVHGRTYKT